MSKQLTAMQAAFCRHLTTGMTAADAAREAGYSARSAKQQAHNLLQQPHIQAEVERLNALLEDEAIADATEVQKFLTSVMRGEITEQILAYGQPVSVPVPTRDRLRAGELLGRAQGMFVDRVDHTSKGESLTQPVQVYLPDNGRNDRE